MLHNITGPLHSNIMLVGECPSESDMRSGKPFSGRYGEVLDKLLNEANISRHECMLTYLVKDRPPAGKMEFYFEDKKYLHPKPLFNEALQQLKKDIETYKPNIVVTFGALAMHYLIGIQGIQSNRGFIHESTLCPGVKVLPTYALGVIDADWKLSFSAAMDIRKAVRNSTDDCLPYDKRILETNISKQSYLEYLNFLLCAHKGPIAVDIETKSPGAHIDIIGIADSPYHAVSFEFLSGKQPRYNLEEETEIWSTLARVLTTREVIFHNGLYDSTVLWYNQGILCEKYTKDTLYAAHACFPELPRSLGYLASICLNVPAWKHTSTESPLLYNAADAANTFGIWEILEAEMGRQGVRSIHDFEIEQTPAASFLQLQGIYVNPDVQRQLIQSNREQLKQLDIELENLIGRKINLASPKQLADLLYLDMRLPIQYKRRKNINDAKKVTTGAEALRKLHQVTGNPVLTKILERKKIDKLLTFLDVPVSENSRVHTCYNVTGATMSREKKGIVSDDEESYKSFGRWSSSESIILPYGSGNLQNNPRPARAMYTAPPGKKIVQADYKQAEAVVVAYLINDQRLKKLFNESFGKTALYCKENNLDVHKLTASMVFRTAVQDVTSEQRKVGKLVRHATNYSAGPAVLAANLGCSIKEAKLFLQQFYMACPQLQLWHKRIQEELKQTRTLWNLFGRKHRFLGRWDDTLFRSAYAYKPQSSVGDLLNYALVDIYKALPEDDSASIYLQLHDAIYVLCNEELVSETMQTMRNLMIRPLQHNGETFYIDVDFKVGDSWKDLEEEDYYDLFGEEGLGGEEEE